MSGSGPVDSGVPRRARAMSAAPWLSAATVIAGLCGYAIVWIVPRTLGFVAYSDFAVFWGLLFLIVAVLSGIQQETTRAVTPTGSVGSRSSDAAKPFVAAAAAGGVVMVVVGGSAVWWSGLVFPGSPYLAAPVVAGATSYVFIAVGYGVLYGVGHWMPLVSMIVVEAVVRLVSVIAAIGLGAGVIGAAWATALAYSVALLTHAVVLSRASRGIILDVGYRRLARNAVGTVVASASLGVMTSGLPFLMGLADPSRSALLGALIVIVTLVRAPIVIVLMALQSLLLVLFRSEPGRADARVRAIVAGIIAVAAILTVGAFFLGPPVFALLFSRAAPVPGWVFAVMVLSSALVGVATTLGSALLARDRHRVYAASWLLGAVVTCGCFALPAGIVVDTVLAVSIAPAASVIVSACALVATRMPRRV